MRGRIDKITRKNKWLCLLSRYLAKGFYIYANKPKQAHLYGQVETTTSYGRYPHLFAPLAETLDKNRPMEVLSFGCSSGEECQTLLSYFPNSTITGTDINTRLLQKASAENLSDLINFTPPETALGSENKYDLITACSVLCRWPESSYVDRLDKLFSFSSFESIMNTLDSNLKTGGHFFIHNTNYRLEDCCISEKYKPLNLHAECFMPIFGKDSKKVESNPKNRPYVFRKVD